MSLAAKNGGVSHWYADIGGLPLPRPPLNGSIEVDVCIVGAGYTGLWTAYYLKQARPELRVALIEKSFAGFGASGRNGGWLNGGFGWSKDKYARTSSPRAVLAMERVMSEAVDEVVRVASRESIDANILRTDIITVACTLPQFARLKARVADSVTSGNLPGRVELLDRSAASRRIDVAGMIGAAITHGAVRVQPAKLVRGLAKAVVNLGVELYEQTTVSAILPRQALTDRGVVSARYVIRATEGFTAALEGLRRTWLPMNSAMIATAPLSQVLWDQIGWHGHELLADASHTGSYAQRTADGRIAMGGRGVPYRFGSRTDRDGVTQEKTIRQLRETLTRLLPQTRDVPIEHAWCGVLGVPRDWCATVGLDLETGIGWAGGYVGQGVSTSNVAGRTLKDLVLGEDSQLTRLPWVGRKVRQWEPEPFRWLGANLMYALYRAADRQEKNQNDTRTSGIAKLANKLTGR